MPAESEQEQQRKTPTGKILVTLAIFTALMLLVRLLGTNMKLQQQMRTVTDPLNIGTDAITTTSRGRVRVVGGVEETAVATTSPTISYDDKTTPSSAVSTKKSTTTLSGAVQRPPSTTTTKATITVPSSSNTRAPVLVNPVVIPFGAPGENITVSNFLSLPKSKTRWEQRLYSPTYVTVAMGYWWIVDCWHHRVLYRKRLSNETDADLDAEKDFVNGWKKLKVPDPQLLKIPHSLATNGRVIVIESSIGGSDNGTRHSLLVFAPRSVADAAAGGDDFRLIQVVPACRSNNTAKRPHRVIFDEAVNAFFLHITTPPHLARFNVTTTITSGSGGDDSGDTRLVPAFCKSLPFMSNAYARSIYLHAGSLVYTMGPGAMFRIKHRNVTAETAPEDIRPSAKYYSDKFRVKTAGGMNDVLFYKNYWYITRSQLCGMIRVFGRDLPARPSKRTIVDDLRKSGLPICRARPFDDRNRCAGGGRPYFMSIVGERMYVPYIFGCSGIISFIPSGNGSVVLSDVRHHFGTSGWTETIDDDTARGPLW